MFHLPCVLPNHDAAAMIPGVWNKILVVKKMQSFVASTRRHFDETNTKPAPIKGAKIRTRPLLQLFGPISFPWFEHLRTSLLGIWGRPNFDYCVVCKLLWTLASLLKWHLRWWRNSCFNLKRRSGDHTVSRAWFGAEVGKRRGQQKHFFFDCPIYFRAGKKNQGSTFADGSDNSVYRLHTGSDWSKGNRQFPERGYRQSIWQWWKSSFVARLRRPNGPE